MQPTIARALLLAALLVPPLSAGAIEFTPQAGFAGPSHGTGTLRVLGGRPRPFTVDSRGTPTADGGLTLVQDIHMAGDPARQRTWRITGDGPGRYRATLTDAAGPVTGTHDGPRLTLRYRARGPLVMRQVLVLSPDGTTIDNRGTVSLLGIPVARLQETIRRVQP